MHLLGYPVGDPADGVLGHAGTVDLPEVRADLPGGQTLRIQRQHDLVDIADPPLTFLEVVPARTCHHGRGAPPGQPDRRCRSTPSLNVSRCGSWPGYDPTGRACRIRGAHSSP